MSSHLIRIVTVGCLLLASSLSSAGSWTANIGMTNNYIWRGLTQTANEPAVSGGIDYSHDSGFYFGTWVSNVQFSANDIFSYEHDLYVGFSGGGDAFFYDVSYLYYNYDQSANANFSEITGTVGTGGFSASLYLLAHTEAEESAGQAIIGRDYDFSVAEAYYLSLDYTFELESGLEIGLHIGRHEGDFVDAFNFADGTDSYHDYSVSLAKEGLSFLVSKTDLDNSPPGLQNDEIKFAVSYALDFDL